MLGGNDLAGPVGLAFLGVIRLDTGLEGRPALRRVQVLYPCMDPLSYDPFGSPPSV